MSNPSPTYQFQDPNSPEALRALLLALLLARLHAGEARL